MHDALIEEDVVISEVSLQRGSTVLTHTHTHTIQLLMANIYIWLAS